MQKTNSEQFSSFDWAVIRLASLQDEKNQPGRLLFATVSLLTTQRPTPAAISKDRLDRHPLNNKSGTVFFREVLLHASEAIAWYRSLNDESSRTPLPSLKEHQNQQLDGIELKTPDLIDDPLWPNLGLPLAGEWLSNNIFEETDGSPFLGTVPSRVHRRFGNNTGFEAFLKDGQAVSFIERRLHINLKNYPEYLGSLVLIVPDPIIHKINNFMIPVQEDKGERIFHRITPQVGQSLAGLKISFFDIEAGLLSNFDTIDVPEDGMIDIEKVSCTGQYGYVITHPLHGLLVYSAPAAFLREMHFQSHIVTEHREIVAPESDSPNAVDVRYSVPRSHPMPKQSIGSPSPKNVHSRVMQAVRNREVLAEAKRYQQYWFEPGQRAKAETVIRDLIGKAQEQLLIADPYFGALQVLQFLYAVQMSQVEITVLTSRLAFETDKESNDDEQNIEQKLAMLDRSVTQLQELGNLDCEVMVMPGKTPKLHDRFMLIDNNVWLIGSSLNALGNRASMMMKLPNPKPVKNSLEDMLSSAKPYKDQYRKYYLENKHKGNGNADQT